MFVKNVGISGLDIQRKKQLRFGTQGFSMKTFRAGYKNRETRRKEERTPHICVIKHKRCICEQLKG